MNLNIHLGHDLDGDPVIWEARGNAHLTITGQSGQGKSYKLSDMILQLAKQGVHTIVLDGSGEYGRDASGKPPAWPPKGTRFLNISSPELPIGTFFQWALPSGIMESQEQCARRAAGMLQHLFTLGSNQYYLLKEVCTDCLVYSGCLSFSQIINQLTEMAQDVLDAESDIPLTEAREAKLAASLLPRLDILADFPETNPDWFNAFTKPGTTIVDIQDISDPYLLKNILEVLLSNLWTHKIRSSSACPLVLVFDECQDLNFKSGSILDRILRKGRKHDIAGWFSTQWFKNTEMTQALGQSACDLCFRPARRDYKKTAALLAPNDQDLYRDCMEALSQLEPGKFFFYNKEEPILVDGWDTEEEARDKGMPP